MSKDIRQLFDATKVERSPLGLERTVLLRLDVEQKRLTKRNLFLFGLADLFSLTGLVISFSYLLKLMVGSGFYSYLSLAWLEKGFVLSYWHELSLSLIESLPVVGALVFLAIGLVFLLSLSKTLNNLKSFYYQY